jgi:hypothetical protein
MLFTCNTNALAINASPVATAIIHLMNIQATCTGTCTELLSKLNTMISNTPDISWISKDGEWPETATALSNRLNEVIPNLAEIGIVVERQPDKHRKSDRITITNNNYQSADRLNPGSGVSGNEAGG